MGSRAKEPDLVRKIGRWTVSIWFWPPYILWEATW